MQDPKCRRFHRVCGDFSLCVNIGEKVTWEEEVPQVFEVMDYIYEGYNFSDGPMEFLFVDVKKESQIEIK